MIKGGSHDNTLKQANQMKRDKLKYRFTLVIGLLTLLTFTLTQCSTGKYYSDFKSKKKNIKRLAVMNPYIFVKSIKGQKESEDNELIYKLEKLISEKTISILSNKYILSDISNTSETISDKDLQSLFSELDNSENHVFQIKIPPFLQKEFKNVKERYCVKVFFQGFYNGYFKPDEILKQELQLNVICINPRHLFRSEIRLVVFDMLENNIVFYEKKGSNDIDPRLPMLITQMTSSILRPLYYK